MQLNESVVTADHCSLLLQELTFVPLYGDMQIAPYQYVTKTPNYDSSKWPCCESSTASPQSNMLPSLGAIRDDHRQYISQLARVNNEVSRSQSRLGFML